MPPDTTGVFRLPPFFVPGGFPDSSATPEETTMEESIKKNAEQATEDQNTELKPFPTSYPGGITPETLFDARTEKIIAAQADKLIRTGIFQQHERDDLANELRCILAHEMASYDPGRDRYTFVATVLAKRGADLVIRRNRHPEEGYGELSLDVTINREGETHLDSISNEDYRRMWGNIRTPEQTRCLQDKIQELLANLDKTDRTICEMIMDGSSYRDIAASMGMQVSAIHWRMTKHIIPVAQELGLGSFAGKGGEDA